jgi:pimeloyl-ACP methyl ester carboxylesterase
LLPWGRNDQFFPEAGAQAYLADVPDAELHLLNGGHFILDERLDVVAELIRTFIRAHVEG